MEKSFGLKFILSRDLSIRNRSPIFEKLVGLKFVKPMQKLVLRVNRPKSVFFEEFEDKYVLSIPQSRLTKHNEYFCDNSRSRSKNSKNESRFDSPDNIFNEERPLSTVRVNRDTQYFKSNEKIKRLNFLEVKGTSAQFSVKRNKAFKISKILPSSGDQIGLKKIVISRRPKPYRFSNGKAE